MATTSIQTWPEFLSRHIRSKLLLLPLTNLASTRSFSKPSSLPLQPQSMARVRVRVRASASALALELKENWLDSLSCPFHDMGRQEIEKGDIVTRNGRGWVIGVDPDVCGALALLKDEDDDDGDGDGDDNDSSGISAQVFDTPHLRVRVGKTVRKRLDAKSMVQLLHSFGAPLGTTAYIEQSTPLPQDGKQGWWSGGFTYGLWLGILVSSGFSVVPISSRLWKDQFQLFGNTKDDSRKAASDLFPSLSSSLKRKKDHGRAEALLIAAYGKGLRIQSNSSDTLTEDLPPELILDDTLTEDLPPELILDGSRGS